jgi:hypothetical protein
LFALPSAIVETASVFFASQILETIMQNPARQILTGTKRKLFGRLATQE